MVAATVVDAVRFWATAMARSRRLALSTSWLWLSSCSSSPLRPTVGRPRQTAMVAGTAPSSRTAASAACAVWKFNGQGRPRAISVDSSSPPGRPPFPASATSGRTSRAPTTSMGPPCTLPKSGFSSPSFLLEVLERPHRGFAHRRVGIACGGLQGLHGGFVFRSHLAHRLGGLLADLPVLLRQRLDEHAYHARMVRLEAAHELGGVNADERIAVAHAVVQGRHGLLADGADLRQRLDGHEANGAGNLLDHVEQGRHRILGGA